MKHVVIKDSDLNGWEYGMLRSFERIILEETGGAIAEIPTYSVSKDYMKHLGHSMNKSFLRKALPKNKFEVNADVAWYILMGPENYKLDLYTGWSEGVKTKILYLYDTLPEQYETIRKLFSTNTWDICITSFNDAVGDLEKLTGRKWHCVPQAADPLLFSPTDVQNKLIHFSSYGRRLPVLHDALVEFCRSNNLYYDYTTHDGKHPTADSVELYKQYAWHLNNSLFNISWPVEVTNLKRAGNLRPITCRWFEAAMSECIILGKNPDNPQFEKELTNNLVENFNAFGTKQEIFKELDKVWAKKTFLNEKSRQLRIENQERWTWQKRVNTILELL